MKNQQVMNLDASKFKAVIFDCDGVLVDSEPYSCHAWNILFQERYHVDLGTDYSLVLGKSGITAAKYYCTTHNIPWTAELLQELSLQKEEVYYSLAHNKLKAMPGLIEFIGYVQKSGLNIAVASSGTREKIIFNLKEGGLWSYFYDREIIDSSMIQQGKPDPEIFQTAAEKLGVEITHCIIIEDSFSGIQAGNLSGAYTIALASTFSTKELKKTPADLIISDFSTLIFKS